MNTSTDFLIEFSSSIKKVIGNKPTSFYRGLNKLNYSTNYNFDQEKNKIETINDILNKIISIIYHPYFHTQTNQIIKRSELSGKLDHLSFQDTLQDPSLWKQKNNKMMPEYVHTNETIDNIDIYENRFICLLINKLEEQIDTFEDDVSPLVESFNDHYQSNQLTFGSYSIIRNIQKKKYPYNPFILKNDDSNKELYLSIKKLKSKIKNIKQTKFYKTCCNSPISRNVTPTNILIHDSLYSYCYKYYISNYKNENKDEKNRQVLYFNYFFTFLLHFLKEKKLLKTKNMPSVKFDENGILTFNEFSIEYYYFRLIFTQDINNYGINIKVILSSNNKEYESNYYLMCLEKYTSRHVDIIKDIKNKLDVDNFFLVTSNNLIKDYNFVITFSYKNNKRSKNEKLLEDLLSYLTILIKSNKDFYSKFCPVCGKNQIQFINNKYTCLNCKSEYVVDEIDSINMLWIISYRKELLNGK